MTYTGLLALLLLQVSIQAYGKQEPFNGYFTELSKSHQVFDPEGYLTRSQKKELEQNLSENFKESSAYIVILKRMSQEYFDSYSKTFDINVYADELAQHLMPVRNVREKSLLAVYSLENRIYRIRTGSELRQRLPDDKVKDIADDILGFLKKGKYFEGLSDLIESLGKAKGKTEPEKKPKSMLFYVVLLVVVFGFAFIVRKKKKQECENNSHSHNREQYQGPYSPPNPQHNYYQANIGRGGDFDYPRQR